MKVALLTEYRHIGGGEINLLELAAELSRAINVILLCSGSLHKEALKRRICTNNIDLTGRRWIKGIPIVGMNRSLNLAIDGCDILHAYSVNILPRIIVCPKPIVWTNHGHWEKPTGLRARVISHFVDHVVTVSNDVHKKATAITTNKSNIPLGVKIKQHNNIKFPEFSSHNTFKILCVGRFQDIKGQDLLIKALRELVKCYDISTNIELNFVGAVNGNNARDQRYFDEVKRLAATISASNLRIFFHGFQTEISDYYGKTNIVVIPSRYESFSMVAVEALTHGRPVIAPNVGGPSEIINTKKIGLLFDPGNYKSLMYILLKAIGNPDIFDLKECVSRGSFYSISRQSASLIDLYSKLLANA